MASSISGLLKDSMPLSRVSEQGRVPGRRQADCIFGRSERLQAVGSFVSFPLSVVLKKSLRRHPSHDQCCRDLPNAFHIRDTDENITADLKASGSRPPQSAAAQKSLKQNLCKDGGLFVVFDDQERPLARRNFLLEPVTKRIPVKKMNSDVRAAGIRLDRSHRGCIPLVGVLLTLRKAARQEFHPETHASRTSSRRPSQCSDWDPRLSPALACQLLQKRWEGEKGDPLLANGC